MNILGQETLIAIPSRGRAEKIWTKHNLMLIREFDAKIFVWDDEATEYFENSKKNASPFLCCVKGIVFSKKGRKPNIGDKRESIMEYATSNGVKKVIMIDDLCTLLYRKRYGSSGTCKRKEQYQDMMEQMVSLCSMEHPLVSLMSEYFIQSNIELFGGPRKLVNQYVCIDVASYKKGVYSQVTTHEDVALHSYFLSIGKTPLLLGTYTRSKPSKRVGGVWEKGGELSEVRQLADRNLETQKLDATYPGIFRAIYYPIVKGGKPTTVRFLTKEKRPCSKDLMKLMRANGYEGDFLWVEK